MTDVAVELPVDETVEPSAPQVVQVQEFKDCKVDGEKILRDGELDIYPAVSGKGYFSVDFKGRSLRLTAGGFVGIIPINDRLVLEVLPRVPLGNLSHLLQVSGIAPVTVAGVARSYARGGQMYPSLVSIYATALADAIDRIASLGLFKDYERREEVTSFPHGRVLANRTVQQLVPRGQQHKLAVTWFQRSADIAVNRCLLYAVHRLGQYANQVSEALPQRDRRRIAVQLNRAHHVLAGVSLDLSRQFMRDPFVTGTRALPSLRAYYQPALELSKLIIAGQAVLVDRPGTHVRLPNLLVSMSDVFEAYLRQVLADRALSDGWSHAVLDGNLFPPKGGGKHNLLDSGPVTVKATPDIVVAKGRKARTCSVVVEVKYKPAKSRPEREHLDQAIGYGVSYRANHIVIAQPKAGSGNVLTGLRKVGTLAGMSVWHYVIDLEDDDLQAEEDLWCRSINTLITHPA